LHRKTSALAVRSTPTARARCRILTACVDVTQPRFGRREPPAIEQSESSWLQRITLVAEMQYNAFHRVCRVAARASFDGAALTTRYRERPECGRRPRPSWVLVVRCRSEKSVTALWERRQTDAGRCARRKDRIWRTASGMRSFGSFHGNMLTSAFGASIADSIATA